MFHVEKHFRCLLLSLCQFGMYSFDNCSISKVARPLYKEEKKIIITVLKRKENDLCGYDTAYTKENLKKKSQ